MTAISVFENGTDVRDRVEAGRIAKLWGLTDVRVADAVGDAETAERHFAPPTLEVELGSMPLAFFTAVEETVRGRRVTDCRVTMTRSGYGARQSSAHGGFDKSMSSTARDFRNLTKLVLGQALERASPDPPAIHNGTCTLEGTIPAGQVYRLQQLLPGLTRGEGVLETAFADWQAS